MMKLASSFYDCYYFVQLWPALLMKIAVTAENRNEPGSSGLVAFFFYFFPFSFSFLFSSFLFFSCLTMLV